MSGPSCDIARDKGADPDSTIVDLRLTPDHNLCITDHWCKSVCGDVECNRAFLINDFDKCEH